MRFCDPTRNGRRPLLPRGPAPTERQSRIRGACWMVCAVLLALVLSDVNAAVAAPAPTPEQVRQATEAVYNDPALHALRAERELRFKNRERQAPDSADNDLRWLRQFARWLSEAGRWLVWLGMALLAAVLVVMLRRWIAVHGEAAAGHALTLPSHVRELDIRPDSLPDDLPAAVRALWQRGQARAALSLLYRGALSRLVHEHGVPVRASSTEGECATLAARHLDAAGGDFVTRLIGLWQLAVYGARLPESQAVLAACDEFDLHLPRRTALPARR
jgi:hypothetical protein